MLIKTFDNRINLSIKQKHRVNHLINTEGTVLNTTLLKPRKLKADTIIGHNIRDLIDPLDQAHFFDTLKKVTREKSYGFVTYSIDRAISFIGLLVPIDKNILLFELSSTPLSNKEHQKQLLLNSARGLIPELQHPSESNFTTV